MRHGEMWATHEVNHRGHEHHWAGVAIVGYLNDGRAAVIDRAGHAFLIDPNLLRSTPREQVKNAMVVRRYMRMVNLFAIRGTPQSELIALVEKFKTPGMTVRFNKGKKAAAVALPRAAKGKAEFPAMRYGRMVK